MGIIHRNLAVAAQAAEVERVKKFESGMISDPITVAPDQKISEAQQIMTKYGISGLPVTKNGRLVGILTNRDLRFEKKLDRAVSALPSRQRQVVTMRDVVGMSAEEVCTALGISAANQRVLLHRARAALRTALAGYYRG